MPIPDDALFPDFDVFPGFGEPGIVGPFADVVATATSPWNDSGGFWASYNAALAAMFEPVYDIVYDHGDPNQTIVATLGQHLAANSIITSIPVLSVAMSVPSNTEITLASGPDFQTFLTTATADVGSTSISINAIELNADYFVGTPVQLAWIPGWSILLDPDNCPDQFLPYLAQFNGTDVPINLNSSVARMKIIGEAALKRGTLASVTSAVKRNLSGTQSVVILERVDNLGSPNAYWFIVVVRPEEVISATSLTNDVNATKPGGVQWTLVQSDAFIWSQAIHTFAADAFSWKATAYTQP
jgi:hypothetical protein